MIVKEIFLTIASTKEQCVVERLDYNQDVNNVLPKIEGNIINLTNT